MAKQLTPAASKKVAKPTPPPTNQEGVHITALYINNMRKIRAVALGLDMEPLIVTGDNEQGKTTLMNSIEYLFTGVEPIDPIRRGAKEARVRGDLMTDSGQGYILERYITRKGNKGLKLKTVDGTPISSPAGLLKSWIGTIAFDPSRFVRMDPDEQGEVIRELTGLDTTKLDEQIKTIYNQRTEVNRQHKDAEAVLRSMTIPGKLEHTEEVNALDLIEERTTLEEEQRAAQKRLDQDLRFEEMQCQLVGATRGHIKEVEVQLAALREKLVSQETKLLECQEAVKVSRETLPDHSERLAKLSEEIANAETINRAIRHKKTYDEKALVVSQAASRAKSMTDRMEEYEAKKLDMAANATMPYPGMALTEEGVTIDGTLFGAISTGKQWFIATKVAMAANPALRIILIRDGALMNKENLRNVIDAAKDGGYQLFIEKFQEEPGDAGIHFVEGAIRFIDGKEQAQVVVDADDEEPSTDAGEIHDAAQADSASMEEDQNFTLN